MQRSLMVVVGIVVVASSGLAWPWPPTGNGTIRAQAGKSEVVLTTTQRLAGAIHSLTWDGQEFIDSVDHGRQLQSACSFDCGKPGPFWAEAYNPTEAGSRRDGAGPQSTSRLQRYHAEGRTLDTTTQMAFWLNPGEKSAEYPALNEDKLSRHLVRKKVSIGLPELPQVLDAEITFTVPEGEPHTFAQFEAWTGYMPAKFERFLTYDPKTKELEPLSDGPGEQAKPVILSTKSGDHAMGVYSPETKPGYGRFRFAQAKVVKWNCVFRTPRGQPVKPGDYRYHVYVAFGTLEDVRQTLVVLHNQYPTK